MREDDPRQVELLTRIREGVESALSVIGEIDAGLLDCSKRLRVDPSNETFSTLSAGITNLGDLVALLQEIRKGADHLASRPVPPDAFSSLEKSLDLFREMQASMERKDWISLADLIQYELSPLLGEGKKEIDSVRALLSSP
ncbi:MAG: hypothetical protein IH576_04190 [Deltaproteobacteria bacterium]|nr:hypothetical protein [Deltaproteobacteria bacterium]